MAAISHNGLKVWQKSMDLVEEVYILSRKFPREELYGVTSQLRRAVVSIPANIAEGNGRSTRRDYAHFLKIAMGSAREVDTLLQVAVRIRIARSEEITQLRNRVDEICRMLHRLHCNLQPNVPSGNGQVPSR